MKKIVLVLTFLLTISFQINAQKGWFSINKIANGNSFSSICFYKDSIGYTVSNEGFILTSSDMGYSWVKKKLTESSLNDIFFIDYLGFIVGDDGNIFKSTDGINWDKKSSNSTQNLNSVYFLDADTGYAFGNGSTILKTINGGESWTNLNLISNFLITDGAFSTPNFGFCTTEEGVLIRTSDYGQSWY
ncbi:MAG: YCF48-related protein, partial [Ignavibacteriota bacterium]